MTGGEVNPRPNHHAEMRDGFVPALSVSQRNHPQMASARWRHAAVARAYEQAAFIAVSDWAHPIQAQGKPSSGVAGLANPNPNTSPQSCSAHSDDDKCSSSRSIWLTPGELRDNQRVRGFEIAQLAHL